MRRRPSDVGLPHPLPLVQRASARHAGAQICRWVQHGAATSIHTCVLLHYARKYEDQNPCWLQFTYFSNIGVLCETLTSPYFSVLRIPQSKKTCLPYVQLATKIKHVSHKSAFHVRLPTWYPDRKRRNADHRYRATQHTIQPNIAPKPHTRQTCGYRRHPEHLHSRIHTTPTSCKASPQTTTPATKVFLQFVRLTRASIDMLTRQTQAQHTIKDSPKPLTPPQKQPAKGLVRPYPPTFSTTQWPGSSATLPQYLFIAPATQFSCPACYGVFSDPTPYTEVGSHKTPLPFPPARCGIDAWWLQEKKALWIGGKPQKSKAPAQKQQLKSSGLWLNI